MQMNVTLGAQVTRGPETWAYIYVALGFALAIEGTIVQMITPLSFPWSIITYAILGTATFWLFLRSGHFQNKLIGIKNRYESMARRPN